MIQNRFNPRPKHTKRVSKKLLSGIVIIAIVTGLAVGEILQYTMRTQINITTNPMQMKFQMLQSESDTPPSEDYSAQKNIPADFSFDKACSAGESFRVHYLITNPSLQNAVFDLTDVSMSEGFSYKIFDNSNSEITGIGFVVGQQSTVHCYYEFYADPFISNETGTIVITLGVPELV